MPEQTHVAVDVLSEVACDLGESALWDDDRSVLYWVDILGQRVYARHWSTGAIDRESFRMAHGEIVTTFSKIHPYLAELRAASGEADFCKHLEAIVLAIPNAEAILTRRREAVRLAMKKKRRSETPKQPGGSRVRTKRAKRS